jgi:hypothetical protein
MTTIKPSARADLWMGRRDWMPFIVTMFILGLTASVTAAYMPRNAWWMHGAWCILGLAVTLPMLARALRGGFRRAIADHRVMFTAAFTLYFLVGASFMTFGPDWQVERALRYYPVDAATAMRANAVNALGFTVALLVATFSSSRFFANIASDAALKASRVPAPVAVGMLALFGVCAFAYTLPFDLGMAEGVVPGVVRTASKFIVVSIFLCASYRGFGAPAFRAAALLIALTLSICGFVLFNKTLVLLGLGAATAGFALVFRPRVVVPIGLVLMLMIYFLSAGPVAFGRNTMGDRVLPLVDRWALVKEGFEAAGRADSLAETSPWGRLSYINAQGAALDFHDAGLGADDFALIPWAFVPRVLVPGKPTMTETPRAFHEQISGRDGSATGLGVFASGYFSGGWIGVFLASVLAGWILAQTSAVARSILAHRALVLLPFALYGVFIAFRIDGSFLADYVGAFVFILYPAVFYWLVRIPFRAASVHVIR